MSINYVLLENRLTTDPDDYMARVQPVGTADMETIIERMIQQGSTVTRADIVSVLEDYHTAIENLVLEGMNVNTPLANFGVSIKGIFQGVTDTFDPARHQLSAAVTAGARLRKTLRERGQVAKQETAKATPNLLEYVDLNTGERNGPLTPGGMGEIIGHRLKFDPTDLQQGIFFIAEDGTETRVAIVGQNKPGDLMFLVPDSLTSGEYRLEVRTVFKGGSEIRSGALDVTLTVS